MSRNFDEKRTKNKTAAQQLKFLAVSVCQAFWEFGSH